MAALKMGSSPDLAKTHKTGNLKYWPSFVSMIRDKTPFRKGAKGDKGIVTLGYKAAGQQKKLVAAMSKITTGREVIGFLNERNAEMPVVMLVLDSIETVNAVVFFFQLSGFINGSFNSSALVSDIDKQIKPLP